MLLHIKANAADLNFTVVTASGEGESSAEGEGSDFSSNVSSSSTSAKVYDANSAIDLGTSSSTSSTNSSTSTNRSPSAVLQAMTGRARLASTATPDPAAVDAAMLELAPALRLSSDLENALVGETTEGEFGLAADQLLGNG